MKKLMVLGHPIGHTLSPLMHNASIRALGLQEEYLYAPLDVAPQDLMPRLAGFPGEGVVGVNLTIPLKEVAFRGLDRLSESAQLLGAVNTVAFTEEGPVGHNTDGFGVLHALVEAFGRAVEGDRIFLLGCGGAGRAVALTAARQGATELILADPDGERVERLKQEIRRMAPSVDVRRARDLEEQTRCCAEADLVIQASPIGMKQDDPLLLPAEAFRAGQRVLDLIYIFPETAFLRAAREAGAETVNGLGMLLHQGAESFRIWTGLEPDLDAMREALEKAVYK